MQIAQLAAQHAEGYGIALVAHSTSAGTRAPAGRYADCSSRSASGWARMYRPQSVAVMPAVAAGRVRGRPARVLSWWVSAMVCLLWVGLPQKVATPGGVGAADPGGGGPRGTGGVPPLRGLRG